MMTDIAPWLEYLITGAVIGGFVVFLAWRFIAYRRRGSTKDPLPRLDRVPREATVVAVHPVSRRPARRRRRAAQASDAGNHDAWLIEVEYADQSGSTIRACLADLIPTGALDRFTVGAKCRVYGFIAPRKSFQREPARDEPAAARCLLTEEHGGIPRAGFDLDGMRARSERPIWPAPRTGSPFLGVMRFVTDGDRWAGEVTGHRTSFPGDPRAVWTRALKDPARPLRRPRKPPRPESVAEVARWEDPDGFGRTELYYAPSFWVFLPLVALGVLIWGIITDPGDGWTGNLFDEDTSGNPWNFWLVWVAVAIWLLIAIGVLVLRVSLTSAVRADNQWILQHGVPCSIHRSPHLRSGGEGEAWPTLIGIDHRLADEQAARIHRALHDWLSDNEVRADLDGGIMRDRTVLSSREIFGDQAAGGYYIESSAGLSMASDFDTHEWVLITEPRDPESGQLSVTTVPREEKLQKIRRKLRAKHPSVANG